MGRGLARVLWLTVTACMRPTGPCKLCLGDVALPLPRAGAARIHHAAALHARELGEG